MATITVNTRTIASKPVCRVDLGYCKYKGGKKLISKNTSGRPVFSLHRFD